jgi:glucosamine--fructose-6-phosphate aminotransferase (isomerizing)
VRGGPRGLDRRRRRQGSCHLPAHKASPIVIATDDQSRFGAALHVLSVPPTHPALAFVLSAMVGHLFGYEAALAIDALARPLRAGRAAIERVTGEALPGDVLLRRLRVELEPVARRYFEGLRVGSYNGQLEASTAVRLATLLRYAAGVVPLEMYQIDEGKVGTPDVLIDDLTTALSAAIEELTRPIDAIKHQAKTVTVGISRTDETLLTVPLVQQVLAAGAPRDQLTYAVLRTLADISPAFVDIRGFTRYRIEERGRRVPSTITVSTGAASPATSPAARSGRRSCEAPSTGSPTSVSPGGPGPQRRPAHRAGARGQGWPDRRPDAAARGVRRAAAHGHGPGRAAGLPQPLRRAAGRVQETEPTFRDDVLATIPVVDLLTEPITSWPTGGVSDSSPPSSKLTPLPAVGPVRWGLGIDLCRGRAPAPGHGPDAGHARTASSPPTSRPTASGAATGASATRPGSRPRRRC